MMFQPVYPKKESPGLKVSGYWKMTLRGPAGELKKHVEGHNVVTDVGKEALAQFLASAAAGATQFPFQFIGIGTNSSAEAASNTALGTELARHTGVASYVSGAVYQVTATFATGMGTGAIVEYGLFNSSAAGTLFARDVESVINKGANDTLTVTAQYTIS